MGPAVVARRPSLPRRTINRNRTYPRHLRLCHDAPAAALTGRLDPTPDVAAAGAWIEARWGWRSRRPWRPTAVVRAAAMSCVATVSPANKASHVDPARVERQGSGGSRNAGRAQNRRTRVPKGNPRDREVPESPQGSRGGFARVSWGRKAPRLSSRHPRPVFVADIAARERQAETAREQADDRRHGSCW